MSEQRDSGDPCGVGKRPANNG